MRRDRRIAGEVRLPGWLDDATVRLEAVPVPFVGETASGALWKAAPGRFLLAVRDVARYLVKDGRTITIDPEPSASADDVARFARMTPMAALLYQRGMAVIHGAAAVRNDRAVLIAGDSAQGKSTLLAELICRGWEMLADDLVPVTLDNEASPVVLPTFPELILWQDAVERLRSGGLARAQLPQPVCASPRGTWSLSTQMLMRSKPCRLESIWSLSTHARDRVEVEEIRGARGFELVTNSAYNTRVAHALLDPVVRMRVEGAVVARCNLRLLRRPRGRWSAGELGELIDANSVR